jgi:hypothetical protein
MRLAAKFETNRTCAILASGAEVEPNERRLWHRESTLLEREELHAERAACSQDYEINFNSAVCLRTSHTILIFKMDGWPTSPTAAAVCVFQQQQRWRIIEVWLCLLSRRLISACAQRRRPPN